MISAFRRYLETWVVRGFFLIMVIAFMSWGIGDVVRMIGTSTWAAKVGGQTIEGAQLQEAFQREMSQATRNLPAGHSQLGSGGDMEDMKEGSTPRPPRSTECHRGNRELALRAKRIHAALLAGSPWSSAFSV